jgi:hypothetical protein
VSGLPDGEIHILISVSFAQMNIPLASGLATPLGLPIQNIDAIQ